MLSSALGFSSPLAVHCVGSARGFKKNQEKRLPKKLFHKSKNYVVERKTSRLFWLQIAYLAVVMVLVLFWRAFWTPDALFLLLFVLFLLLGQGKKFFLNFAPFIALLLTYDSLRGFADNFKQRVHVYEMIDFDKWIGFGKLPTLWFQEWLWHGKVQWYDFYLYALYMAHFLFPVLLAVYIWKRRSNMYLRYISALVVLSYLGFLTYALFPAMPPWMADRDGYISGVHKISTDIWFAIGAHGVPGLYAKINPNEVAAMPSLHAAYPMLFWLFVNRIFTDRRKYIFLIYPFSVWFGIVYMGEHYVIDALVGILYAIAAFYAVHWIFDRYGDQAKHRWQRLKGRLGVKESAEAPLQSQVAPPS